MQTHLFFCIVSSLLVTQVLSWPGVGIISIYYYKPEWAMSSPITVQYIGTGLDDAVNVSMLPYPGPDSRYQWPGWHYVEIGSNNISGLQFINATGSVDPSGGLYFEFDMAGEFVVSNNSVAQTEYYEPGCPGYPPDSAEIQCYSNGHCQFVAGVCECDPNWGCPACECLLTCNNTNGYVAVTNPKSHIQLFTEVATAGHCCGLCDQHVGCVAANFFYTNFTCDLLTTVDGVEVSDPLFPSILIRLPEATPAPTSEPTGAPTSVTTAPTSPPKSFLQQHQWTFVAAGCGVALLLIIGGVFVRFITSRGSPTNLAKLGADYSGKGASLLYDGKYKTIRILGRGAFGVVYLVTSRAASFLTTPKKKSSSLEGSGDALLANSSIPQAEHYLAMKVIHCTSDDEMMAAFTEFKALNALQGHEGIVPVVDMFMSWEIGHNKTPSHIGLDANSSSLPLIGGDTHDMDQGNENDDSEGEDYMPVSRYLCIVMEYFPEGTLDRAVVEHETHFRIPAVVLSIFRQILSAMAHSHKKNIIHRDLKPGNVLLANGGTRIVISDFGLAQDLENTSTQAGGGTLHYLAPEQIDHHVSRKSDVWSIACIIVAIATGHCGSKVRALFMLRSQNTFETDLRAELIELPNWAVDLIVSMLASLPLDRPSVDECLAVFDDQCAKASTKIDPPSLACLLGPQSQRPSSSRGIPARHRSSSQQQLVRQGTSDSIASYESPSPRNEGKLLSAAKENE